VNPHSNLSPTLGNTNFRRILSVQAYHIDIIVSKIYLEIFLHTTQQDSFQSIMAAAIPTVLKGYALFAFLTGTGSLVYGENMVGDASIFKPQSATSALADSQIRYLGAQFATTGAIVWWISYNFLERQVPLAIVGAGVVAGGVGRIAAGAKHGFGPRMKLAMWIELVGPTLFYIFGKAVGQW
jgi:hypothetical protein